MAQFIDLWWAYLLAGLACGIFSATFGVGSGIILVPALVLIFSLPQKSAQGTCLAVMVPMALVGAIRYKLNPDINVDITVTILLSIGAVVGALIGSGIAAWAPASVLRKLFAIIMIVVGLKMLISPSAAATKDASEDQPPDISPRQVSAKMDNTP